MKIRSALMAITVTGLLACDSVATGLNEVETAAVAKRTSDIVYTSGTDVKTWNAIAENSSGIAYQTYCTASPKVGLGAAWTNEHNAYVLTGHPWAYDVFFAPWINAWNSLGSAGSGSTGPGYYNWTKYRTQVSGNGSFVIRLMADNCSWIYLDGILVGVQNDDRSAAAVSYGLSLNGTHTLEFIIFDGGGAAGGKFILETTTNPPPPLDSDGDTHPNTSDAFPFDPTEWADSDGDGTGDNKDKFPNDPAESADSDGDGVGDNADPYDNSNTGPALMVGSCNTGVANWNMGGGTWANDLIAAAYSSAANHGKFVKAVETLADGWKKSGRITGAQHGAIVSCAARTK